MKPIDNVNITAIDWTKPVQTKDGQVVEIITTKARGNEPVMGYRTDRESVSFWNVDGTHTYVSAYNLENVPPPKKVGYFNIYKDQDPFPSVVWTSRKEADYNAQSSRIGRIRVEYEEGQFDE